MITISIDPILFNLGPFTLSWHSLFMTIGIAVGVWLPARLVSRAGLSIDRFYTIALIGIPGGIIGARLVHVIDYWDVYMANPGNILALQKGGLALWGGILGGILAVLIYARVKKISIAEYADKLAPGMILGQAIGRIGDVINGEHFSKSLGLPWGVVYTHPNSPAYGLDPSHLAVGYEMILDLIIFGVVWKLQGRFRPDGAIFLLYLVAYSFGRFFISFLRLDSNTVLLGINQQQWLSLMVLVVALPMLLVRLNSRRKSNPAN
ncbi:MAG: prolipoprotein diacylglyceryl transferase [Dehalococcoidales bacterium]